MKLNEAIELAAHKAALELQKTQLLEAKAELENLRRATVPPYNFPSRVLEPRQQAKAGPDPRAVRDAVLAAIQKGLIQRLKRFFQGLQLQALRTLRGEATISDVERPYWDEPAADMDITQMIDGVIGEVGAAAFDVASKNYGIAVAWTAENFWLPQYIGMRADMIKGITRNLKEELIHQLREGYERGEGIPQLSQRVTEVFREAIDWKAERIARTETMQAYAAASLAAYQAGGVEKVQMHDGPHDDKANCIDVDGLVVNLAEAGKLMAEEHPNGVRGVAPFMEQLLVPPPVLQAAPEPKPTVDVMAVAVEAMGRQQVAHQEFVKEMMRSQHEFLVKALDRMTPPDVRFDLPPVNVNFHDGAIKSTTTVAEGAIQSAPVTFAEGAIQPQVPLTFAEGAIQATTNFQEGAIKVEPAVVNIEEGAIRVEAPIMVAKGAVESNTPITVVMPEQPEIVVQLDEEEDVETA